MQYQEVKQRLEGMKLELISKMENPELSIEEREEIKRTLANYDYIIELTDMNHFERSTAIH